MFLGLQIIMGIILKIVVLMVPALDVSPLLIGMANLFAAAVTISIGLRRAGASWRDLPIITPFRLACVGPLALAIAGGVMGTRHFLDGGRRQP